MPDDNQQEPRAPIGGDLSAPSDKEQEQEASRHYGADSDDTETADDPYLSEPYHSSEPSPNQPFASADIAAPVDTVSVPAVQPAAKPPAAPPPKPPPPSAEDDEDSDDEGMLRMSFMEHLEELRSRILKAVYGMAVAFVLSLTFTNQLWHFVSRPAVVALTHLGVNPPNLAQITPMETFNVVWLKMPLYVSVFLGSPWILYQVWAFISPGLYSREKKWAVPFIACTAGLFIGGGCFAYFVAFRYGIEFLLGIGRELNVTPVVSINEYFSLFVNVTLGIAVVFELPVLIFFLTLLRIASPRFLLANTRYAVLAITVLAAIVTPTPDLFNMMLFAAPMCLLFFLGVGASYILVLKREGRPMPWGKIALVVFGLIGLVAAAIAVLIYRYHYYFVPHWPFLVK